MLKTWFWKPDVQDVSALEVWQKTCQYLYLSRLRDNTVFHAALAAGSGSRDFFGIAYGKEDTSYVGFSFGQAVSPVLDSTLLVIEPHTALAYAEAQGAATAAATPTDPEPTVPAVSGSRTSGIAEPERPAWHTAGPVAMSTAKRLFYASIELDPIQAKKQFTPVQAYPHVTLTGAAPRRHVQRGVMPASRAARTAAQCSGQSAARGPGRR